MALPSHTIRPATAPHSSTCSTTVKHSPRHDRNLIRPAAGSIGLASQATIEQPQTVLKQLIARLDLTQLGEQTRQLGAGFWMPFEGQAALEIAARLADRKS